MKTVFLVSSVLALSGCAVTPADRDLWQGFAGGISAGSAAYVQQLQSNRYMMQTQPPLHARCSTSYSPLFKEYETVCR
jgi:hypothetical protein